MTSSPLKDWRENAIEKMPYSNSNAFVNDKQSIKDVPACFDERFNKVGFV